MLTNTEINQRIAEACGWKRVSKWRWEKDGKHCKVIPQYTHNLNAMHEAEMMLPEDKRKSLFYSGITMIVGGNEPWCYRNAYYASARQRAEAFLKTIGRWSDEP